MKTVIHIPRSSARARHALFLLMAFLMVLVSALRVSGQSTLPDTVCFGETKHYWVAPNPITGSSYTWQVDGVLKSSAVNDIFITWDAAYTLGTHTISVQEKSAAGCEGAVRTIQVNVIPSVTVSVLVSPGQNPACSGAPVTFTASVTNGGTTPLYNWFVNSNPVGATAGTYTYIPANGDMVSCEVTSNARCALNNPAVSIPVIMQVSNIPVVTFTPCYNIITSVEAKPFTLRGGLPLGGSYSGEPGNVWVNNPLPGMFNPQAAPIGPVAVTYTYTNSAGCSDSTVNYIQNNPAQSTFTCGSMWLDIRDNKSYPTILIDTLGITQCWLAKNLDYGNHIQSTQMQSDNCVNEKYCYNNDAANCTSLGGLYQWDELMTYDNTPAAQGICPPGWHVPTESEWTILLDYYGGNAFAGRPMQQISATGFNALPGGVLYQNNAWSLNDLATLFWTSTQTGPVKIISHGMNKMDPSVSYYESLRNNAFPMRCVKD
ncbi:MAG: hypothetical protein NTW16_18605 [Bacteroidetes bacterium]|nr:hypothetical protein [Bacteroidota bacterium]